MLATPRTDDVAELAALLPEALVLLDRSGAVAHANAAAEALLRTEGALSVRDGVLRARRKGDDRLLREGLAGLTATQPKGVVCFRSREGVPVVVIDAARLPTGLIAARVRYLIAPPRPSVARLRSLFGFTPAEARVALAMLGGQGMQAIARDHGIEAETVRSQVKRLRTKAGARSQNQLLGALAGVGVEFVETRSRPN